MTSRSYDRPAGACPDTAGMPVRMEAAPDTVVQELLERLTIHFKSEKDRASEDLQDDEFSAIVPRSASKRAVEPDVIAAAILLGTAMSDPRRLLHRLDSSAPIVVVEVPDEAWIGPTVAVATSCFRRPAARSRSRNRDDVIGLRTEPDRSDAVVVAAIGRETRSAETTDKRVATAFREYRPLIGICTADRSGLPFDLLVACDETIVVGPLDPEAVELVVRQVVGSPPSYRVSSEIAAQIEPSDLRIAIHEARGAEESVRRLLSVVDARRRTIQKRLGPRLAELAGYGPALKWGMAAAADLAAYARGEIPFSSCEPGIILSGVPGSGKTMFASALANEAGVAFVAGSLAQWQSTGEAHLGTTLKAMRRFFEDARQAAPCIALVDELDSFGDRRQFAHHHRNYGVQIVNGFLECLDGAGGREGVVMIGTTNDLERIDPAIIRSGRFDRRVEIPLPTIGELAAIFRYHLGCDLAGVDLEPAARRGLGGTGADCAAWIRRARGKARRAGRKLEIEDLLDEVGPGASEVSDTREWRTAVHESGHAVAAHSLGHTVRELALHPAGGIAHGSMVYQATGAVTSVAVRDVLVVVLAGRAAESLLFGEPSAGAASDLAKASAISLDMHCRWGLGSGLAVYDPGPALSGVRRRVEKDLSRAAERATEILSKRRAELERIARSLLDRRALTCVELAELLDPGSPPTIRVDRGSERCFARTPTRRDGDARSVDRTIAEATGRSDIEGGVT